MDESEQNKSEQPTSFKLSKAREKGSVARGMDLGYLTSLAAFLGYVWLFGEGLMGQISRAGASALVAAPTVLGSGGAILTVTGAVLAGAVRPLAFLAAALFVVVLVFEIIQTGVVFSTQPLKPDFNRLNPAQGLKRLFSVRLLIETGKNVLKLALYTAIAVVVIRWALRVLAPAASDAARLADALHQAGFRMLAFFVLAAVLFMVLDQMIVRRDFLKKMRMSRRDIRRESRDREGEPRMKQRRKQLHAEFVKASQSLRGIRGADVLITNPTHYAVALRYDNRTMEAPAVVSLGTGQFAQRLRRLAFLHGVTIIQDPVLARALYAHGQLGQQIPEPFFRKVADVYLDLRARAQTRSTGPRHA